MHLRLATPKRSSLAALVFPLYLLLAGCSTQRDAMAAAQQLSATAATLQAYYSSLVNTVRGNEEAQAAQFYLNGTPFDSDTRAALQDSRTELNKRAAMAGSLCQLSAMFANLVHSSAAADVTRAANDLNTQLVDLKAIAADEKETDALKLATSAIVRAVMAHDEVKAARLIKPVATSLAALFDREQDSYVSFANSYYQTAASNTNLLIDKSQVSNGFLYGSSLHPFGLSPAITDASLKNVSASDLKQRVSDRLSARQQANRIAAAAESESLHMMRDRIALVADGKTLHSTEPPFTLEGVKAWVLEIKADTGE